MVEGLIKFIGFFHLACFLMGALGLFHYRVYIGMKDVVYIPKAEYEELKAKSKENTT